VINNQPGLFPNKLAGLRSALKIRFSSWTIPVALFAVSIISYAVFIPWFGMYGDDWIYLYAYHVGGPLFFIDFVSWDRPFSAWIYLLTTPIFGENIVLYHIFLVILRWLSALLVWWVLRMVWKDHEWQVTGVATLLLIYPGFRQQPLPLEFMLHFSSLIMFLLSLGLMLLAIREKRRFWLYTVLSLLTSAWAMFPIEYFFGLEVLRPIFLYIILMQIEPAQQAWKKRIWLTLKKWAPYVVLVLFFIIWRVWIFKFPFYQPTNLAGSPLQMALAIGGRILTDLYTSLLGSWGLVFQFPELNRSGLRYYGFTLLSIILAAIYFSRLNKPRKAYETGSVMMRENWGVQAFWIGLVSMVAVGPPFWVAGVPMYLTYPWDRTTLAFMLGACMIVMGLVEMVIHERFRTVILAALVGLGMGSQYLNAKNYYSEWQKMRALFWQLSWRAPALVPGTLIIYDNLKLNHVSDNDLTPLLNWMYAPESHSKELAYKFYDLNIRYQTQYTGLEELEEGVVVDHINRSMSYTGNTSDAIVIDKSSAGCMRLLKPGDELLPNLSQKIKEAIKISHPDQVVEADRSASPPLMGPEPELDWCYYFQKADLARAKEEWSRVGELGDDAFELGLKAVDKTEYLPFIEAYTHTGEWEKSSQLSIEAGESDIAFRPAICAYWTKKAQDGALSAENKAEVELIKTQSGC